MCGINGFIGENIEQLRKMNTSTVHRGPDWSGEYIDTNISLGHNLLSIRDTALHSHQPYHKKGSPWILLHNGQIYNTTQLKKNLNPKYRDVSLDTSILYATIEKYGWGFIEKIHGMFAIALYNSNKNTLRLYRDPAGQKPIYYYSKGQTFIFSSEIKSILTNPDIDRAVDTNALMLSASLGYIPGDKTLFRYIHKLNVSEELTVNVKNSLYEKRYYISKAEKYYPSDFSSTMSQLIGEHIQSKQKIAINLSGGLDSSLLLHEMSKHTQTIDTYSTVFDHADEQFNRDAILAKKLSSDYGCNHHEIVNTKQTYCDNLIESLECIEEPNYNISLPVYLLTAKEEGAHGDSNRVILSGDGGDEVFGGYPIYLASIRMARFSRFLTPSFFSLLKNARNHTNFDYTTSIGRWQSRKQFTRHFLNDDTNQQTHAIHGELRSITDELIENYAQKNSPIYDFMMLDRFIWLAGENFIRTDKLYMSQSVELRSPLSYHPFRLHMDNIIPNNEYINQSENKIFVRNYYEGKLPDYITHRKDKTGWRAPIQDWYDEKVKDLFLEIVGPLENTNTFVNWKKVNDAIRQTDEWPGKHVHLYLSLAILSQKFNIEL